MTASAEPSKELAGARQSGMSNLLPCSGQKHRPNWTHTLHMRQAIGNFGYRMTRGRNRS